MFEITNSKLNVIITSQFFSCWFFSEALQRATAWEFRLPVIDDGIVWHFYWMCGIFLKNFMQEIVRLLTFVPLNPQTSSPQI